MKKQRQQFRSRSKKIDKWCTVTREGLEIHWLPSWKEFVEFGESLEAVEHSLPMIVGDWLNTGENKFGEKYTQAVTFAPRSYQTMLNWKSVCKKVPLIIYDPTSPTEAKQHRRKGLHYSHYQAVAPLPLDEQGAWMDKAVDKEWGARKLLNEINGTKSKTQKAIKFGSRIRDLLDKLFENVDDDDLRTEVNEIYSSLIGILSKLEKISKKEEINV